MLSICVCTYNRGESLNRTLSSLVLQQGIESESIEVLVVDNNSTDNTPKVLESFRRSLPVRWVTERQQGVAHARNRAVAEFRGDVLLFADDDVRLERGWLAAYHDAIRRFPSAEYFGGRILPDWRQAKPRWIGDEPLPLIDGVLGWFDHGVETRPFLATEPVPFGASLAVRRSLFEKIGSMRVDLGTGGTVLGPGEETEFLMRARDAGAHGIYVGEALCFHNYDPRRLTLSALYYNGMLKGQARNAILGLKPCGSYRIAAWFVLRGLYQLAKGRGDRFRQCIINAGIQVGTRPEYYGRKRLHEFFREPRNRFGRRGGANAATCDPSVEPPRPRSPGSVI
jgi:glycosyltransferase involved in cell wall biosynthesis